MMTSTSFLYDSVVNRVLTGGERSIAFRADDQWARKAKENGVVKSIKGNIVCVEYSDSKVERFEIGKHFGVWSGNTIPHEIVTNLKAGDHFNKDDIIAYNRFYFAPDPVNPGHVIFKRGIRGNMVLIESRDTLEDASFISRDFANRLATGATEKRHVKIAFDNDVEFLKEIGDHVDAETILCNLTPPMSGLSGGYKSSAAQALDVLNLQTPKASHAGIIDHIEVMYTGDPEMMTESLREFVTEYDAKLYRKNRDLGIPVTSSRVDPSYAIEGTDIGEDQVIITYYITERVGANVGDKVVYYHQLKSIISNVIDNAWVTENGDVIDIGFARASISNRIVNSPDLVGTTNSVLALLEKKMIKSYFGTDKPKL